MPYPTPSTAIALGALLLAMPALAQPDETRDPIDNDPARETRTIDDDQASDEASDARDAMDDRRPPPVVLSLTPSAMYTGDRDFDSGAGSVESVRVGLELGASLAAGERGRLNLSLDADVTSLDVTVAPGAIGGTNAATIADQFDEIVELGLGAIYTHRLEGGTRVFVGGGVGFAGEGDADIGDSFVWNALGGVSLKINDNLRLGGGVGVFAQLEDGVRVVPIPSIELTIDERWSLESERAGLKLNYAADDELDFGLFARFEPQDYRIDDDNTLVPGGAVSSSGFPISTYAAFNRIGPASNISLYAEVGVLVGGETEIFSAAGNTVVEDDLDESVFAGLRLRIRF